MTNSVSMASISGAQRYQQICAAAAAATRIANSGTTASAFTTAANAGTAFSTASNGSTLNAGLLGALLNLNGSSTAAPNSATTAPDAGSATPPAAAQHHRGISAYLAQLASSAADTASLAG